MKKITIILFGLFLVVSGVYCYLLLNNNRVDSVIINNNPIEQEPQQLEPFNENQFDFIQGEEESKKIKQNLDSGNHDIEGRNENVDELK